MVWDCSILYSAYFCVHSLSIVIVAHYKQLWLAVLRMVWVPYVMCLVCCSCSYSHKETVPAHWEISGSIALLEYCCSVALIQTTTFCTCMWVGLFWSSRIKKLLMNISSSFCCVYRVPLATLQICDESLERMFGPYMRDPSKITSTIEHRGQRGKFTTSNFQRANPNVCTHFTVVMSLCWKSWVRGEFFNLSILLYKHREKVSRVRYS